MFDTDQNHKCKIKNKKNNNKIQKVRQKKL